MNQERVFQILLGLMCPRSRRSWRSRATSTYSVSRLTRPKTKFVIRSSSLFKVTVNDVQTLRVKGKDQAQPLRIEQAPVVEKSLRAGGAGSGN